MNNQKSKIKNRKWAWALCILHFAFSISAQVPPTNQVSPSTVSVMTDTNSVLKQPTNFFSANSNLIQAVVPGGTDANALHKTNIPPTYIFIGNASSNAFATNMTGDVTLNTNGAATLAATGVTAGTATKVTVDAKGRITGTNALAAADIPNLDASKITTGTLALAQLLSSVHTNTMAGAATFNNKVTLNSGGLRAYTTDNTQDPTANSGHSLATSNGVDNVLTLINYDTNHFSAIVMADYSNQWHTAFGWGNPNTNTGTPYPQMNYWESLFHDYAGFVTGGELEFGMDGGRTGGATGDLIRWKSGSTNVANALVVFRVSGNGTTSTASNLNVGGITTFSNSVSSTSFIQATRHSATQGPTTFPTATLSFDAGNNASGMNYELSSPASIAMLTFGIAGAYSFCATTAGQGWGGFPSLDIGTDIANGNTIGNAVLKPHGSFGTDIKSKSANYTNTMGDSVILVTSSGKTITLPDAVSHCAGRIYTVKLTVSGTATVATTSSQNIDGATTYSLSAQYKYVTVQSDGTQWWVIANN